MPSYYLSEKDLSFIVKYLENDLKELQGYSIFITGATGIIGKWLLASLLFADDELNLNLSISILTRSKKKFGDKYPLLCHDRRVTVIEEDVRHFCIDNKVDLFIHGAADVVNVNTESETYVSNILGTYNSLLQATKSKAKRFLYLSSGAVYGKSEIQEKGINEDYRGEIDFINLNSAYSLGKCGGEFLTNCFANEYDISVSSARCFAMAGPHLPLDKHFAFGNFMHAALNNSKIEITGNGEVYRSYLYLADVCIWLLKIAIKGENRKSYNVGNDQSISIKSLAEQIKLELKSNSVISIANNDSNKSHSDYYFPNTEYTKEALNLSVNYSLSDTIKLTSEWQIEAQKTND